MKYSEYSVVIIGSGAAGLYSALKISRQIELPDGILLVTKSNLGESNSKYAQGGIVGVLHQNPGDSVNLHVEDTLKAGAGLSESEVVRYISQRSDEVINDLIDIGVPFDKDNSGNLAFTLEAAHSFKRILHVNGDATGKGITDTLVQKVLEDENITVIENSVAAELLVNSDSECKGVILYNDITGEHEIVYTSAVILATGGVGQLYKYTTNPDGATGDGIDLAYNAGAIIQDMEFIQFHPTALALNASSRERFLISEAVRGEGAKLVDSEGNEFMSHYHDKRELAPRDIVTRAIYNEMNKTHSPNVYLNASIIDKTRLFDRFPTISKKCIDRGLDISQKPIPVAPAAHYCMGGIKATIEGKTSIRGLYAIGETASTGLHGANRLASNSLLECVVSAYELADYLSFANLVPPKKIDSSIMNTISLYEEPLVDVEYNIELMKQNLKDIMWENVGIIRSAESLNKAKEQISKLKKGFLRNRKCSSKEEYEYRNMLNVAALIVEAAFNRKESRGAHSRSDYPKTDSVALHSTMIKQNNRELAYVE